MSKVLITRSKLDDLAVSISAKSGESVPLTLDEMKEAVDGIQTGGTPTLQAKSVSYTPSESSQSETVTADSGYDGLSSVAVSVGAISSTYVGSGITQRTSTDSNLYTTESYITTGTAGRRKLVMNVPAGYYATNTTKTIQGNVAGITDLPTQAATTITPSETQQTAASANTWLTGDVTVSAISSTYVGSGITQRSSSDLTASGATVTAPSGYYASQATKSVASGTAGTPTASKGTVSNHSVSVTPSVTNTTGYITGGTKTGTAVSVSASELVSGTYTVSSSGTQDVTNYASISVASGTAGTPTATKGAVSNHSVSVTPSVTNTTGYITGSTKTGTAVTVSASELVSGSETKTANGTYDVTNLAELVVNVSGGGGASNFVTGTFTTGSGAGVSSLTIPYTGSGYPLMAIVVIEGGAYNSANTDWYNSMQRYAVGQWTMTKAVMTSAPSYTTSGAANQGVTTWVFKNSASSSTSYSRSSAMNTNVFSSSNASNAGATCVRLKTGNVLSYYVNTSSYGLLPSMTYRYFIAYSS